VAAKNSFPLGYVDLPDGAKAIYPMNDIFLNYTFEDMEYWEALRLATNLIIEAYKCYNPKTKIMTITGKIKVRTQYKHLLGKDNTTRNQDLRIIEDETDSTYLEFQNRAKPDVPVEIRSVDYFGLGIGQSRGKPANQIWLLAQDVDAVLQGETFTRYILKDEVTENDHPATSGIMYVSLTKLSKAESPVEELAAFLLGKISDPKSEVVKKIADAFKASFSTFKADKEVAKMLTLAERYKHDGLVEGEARGKIIGEARGKIIGEARGKIIGEARGVNKLAELIKGGLSIDEALCKIDEEQDKQLADLNKL